ncbi:MAG: ABC-type transport auxiliary lipoprotein family protein [Planctomycetes bacterium]|jgi:cholesterol transport system auxiliary component|nr:ABC-type transport auxiliary lipoprotein family protein [Planctomycetota bacterium]
MSRLLLVSLSLALLVLSGCSSGSQTADRTYYILEATRTGAPVAADRNASLRVRRLNVDEVYATRQLVYRLDEFRYESDYYHQFLVLPGVMLTDETRDWLADSGLFARVSSLGSRYESTYALEGNIQGLYADFTNRAAPQAVVEIRFFLLNDADAEPTVLLSETYKAASPIAARSAEAVVAALSQSLAQILTRLEADLQKVLAPPPSGSAAGQRTPST